MPNYRNIQLISYGSVTSTPTPVLTGDEPNRFREDLKVRGETLCGVADWAAGAFQLGDADTLKVFVAPEFYFRYGGPSQPATALGDSYPNGEALLPGLIEEVLKPFFAADRFADWIVIPGTMFWHKGTQDDPSYFNTTAVVNGGPDTALTPAERAANANPTALATVGAATTNQKALMSTIDYAIGVDRTQWDAALNPMFRLSFRGAEFWRWHTFAVHGKHGPDGRPLVFGLEVCLEHIAAYAGTNANLGLLRTMENLVPDQPEIDIHLVTSCGMSLDPAFGITAREDGYAMICDGMNPGIPPVPWPRTDVQRVTAVERDGRRTVAHATRVLDTQLVPPALQVGGAGTHTPPDTVAVWEAAPLADRG
ncbi:hypothetical protein [Actinokineospora inagensis]|uniref:hypothetical protein n=1 Tax=Actinokineospora inagensis TaxID=103730 RepID=UPI0004189B04|nr:hypothetical protein [Actinokineospora inagensis]